MELGVAHDGRSLREFRRDRDHRCVIPDRPDCPPNEFLSICKYKQYRSLGHGLTIIADVATEWRGDFTSMTAQAIYKIMGFLLVMWVSSLFIRQRKEPLAQMPNSARFRPVPQMAWNGRTPADSLTATGAPFEAQQADRSSMRIAHVIEWLTALGGGPTSVLATLAHPGCGGPSGYRHSRSSYARAFGSACGPGRPHRGSPGATPRHLWWYSGPAAREIREQIAGHDIVHIHATWRYHFLAAATYAAQLGIPYVVSPHGNLDHYCLQQRKTLKWIYFQLIDRRRINAAAAIHCCSQMELREIVDYRLNRDMFVIPNPVEEKLYTDPSDHEAAARRFPSCSLASTRFRFWADLTRSNAPKLSCVLFAKLRTSFPTGLWFWLVLMKAPR